MSTDLDGDSFIAPEGTSHHVVIIRLQHHGTARLSIGIAHSHPQKACPALGRHVDSRDPHVAWGDISESANAPDKNS